MKIHENGSSISPGDALTCPAGPIPPPLPFVSPPVSLLSVCLGPDNVRDIDCRRQPFSAEHVLSGLQLRKVDNLPRALHKPGLRHLEPAGGRRWDGAIHEGFITT